MATMNSIIEYVDRVKPNVYEATDKYRWLSKVEGVISAEVHGMAEPVTLAIPADADKELLVPAPYDDVYAFYLCAMIDFHNQDYEDYNNAAQLFGEHLELYKKYYIRQHGGGSAKNFRNVMG